MDRRRVASALSAVGRALKRPEEFASRWERGAEHYAPLVWLALASTSVAGTMVYGMTMGLLAGPQQAIGSGLRFTAAAGLAWALPLPGIYVLNSLTGSRLSATGTALAAVVTTSWGGLAMLAAVPVSWFLTAAVPVPWFVRLVHIAAFAAVGVAMVDVFGRVVARLEPLRGRRPAWFLAIVGAIGVELFHAFDLFLLGLPR